jgi:hypothetical protein
MLEEYKALGKRMGIAEHKIEHWWASLTPKEKEGMRRMGAVGLGGAGLAMAIAYNPEAMPLAFIPTNLYIQRMKIRSALEKLHIIHHGKDKLKRVI